MNIFTRTLSLVVAFGVMALSACTNEPPVNDTPNPPVDDKMSLEIETTTIELSFEGGEQAIPYTLKNGIDGIDIVAESEVSWINNIKTENSVLYFTVARNMTTSERSAVLQVKYPNLSSKFISVKQAAYEGLAFELELADVKSTSCTTKIHPSDPEMPYIVYMSEVDYFLSANITTAEQLFEDDYRIFTGWAEQYEASNLEKFLYLNQICYQGDMEIGWTGMVPDREYILYVYAIEFNEEGSDYTLASPVFYESVVLPTYDYEDLLFDVDVTVDGPMVYYDFTPLNWEGKYYVDIYSEGEYMYLAEGETPSEEYCKLVASTWLSIINIYMQSGYSGEQLLDIMCLQGPDSYSELREADTNYCMVFYGIEMVDGLPQVVTRPYIKNFRTGVVEASDMVIDIKVENCYVRIADLIIEPTTDEPYVLVYVESSMIPFTENSQIIEWLSGYNLQSYRGPISAKVIDLVPDTDYSVLAFGYYGGVVTTDLFRYDFKTEPEGVCDNSVLRVETGGPYSLAELEAAYPDTYYNYGMMESMGWYLMYGEIFTEKPTDVSFYSVYSASEIVSGGTDWIKADLVSSGYAQGSVTLFSGQNDKLYIMCAVTMDDRGNYSDLWMSEPFSYNLNQTTKRPISEFIDKMGLDKVETQALLPESVVVNLQSKF